MGYSLCKYWDLFTPLESLREKLPQVNKDQQPFSS